MKKKRNKIISVCMILILLANMTACGKSKSESIRYTGSVTEVPINRASVDAVAGYDHRFAIFSQCDEAMNSDLRIYDMKEGLIETEYTASGYRYYAAAMNEKEIYAYAEQIYENEYHLLKFNYDGTLLYDMDITEVIGDLSEIWLPCSRMCCSDKYVCLLFDSFGVAAFSPEGEYLYKTENNEINEITMSGSETCLFVYASEKEQYIGQLKLGDTKASEKQISQKTDMTEYGYLAANTKGDIYFGNLNKVYCLDGKKLTEAASLNAFGGLNGSVRAITLNDAMEVCIFAVREQAGQNAECAVMELYEGDGTEPVKEKLTCGVIGLNGNMQEVIQNFNASQTDFYIEGIDYDEESLGLAVLSGDAPDIVVLNIAIYNYVNYFKKGVFLDLTPYLESSALDTSDYYENIMCGIRYEGQIETLVPCFALCSAVGDGELFREQDMDIRSLCGLLGSMEEDILLEGASSAINMFGFFCSYGDNPLVDYESGRLLFSKEEMVEILEFCAAYSDIYSSEKLHDLAIANHEVLLRQVNLSPWLLVSTLQTCKTIFGNDYMYVGYPSLEGKGNSTFLSCYSLSITSGCEKPELAWKFIEYWFSDEMQEKLAYDDNWRYFPVNRDMLEESLKESFITDSEDVIALCPGQTTEAAQLDDEDLQKLLNLIESVSDVYVLDREYGTIIAEEASAFFGGGQSAEKTADLIMERLQLYLDEQ